MSEDLRISTKPSEFDDYMNRTDDWQLTVVTPPDILRYTLLGWTQEESNQWTAFRQKSNELWALLNNPDSATKVVRQKMKDHIKTVRAYDNNKSTGHHLLDKVALNGTIDDCATFNVKRGTTLQADPVHHTDDPVLTPPVITLKDLEPGYHRLSLKYPDASESKKVPDGAVFAKVFRYVGTAPPASIKTYELIGSARRAEIVSKFEGITPPEGDVKLYAWYFARYENKKGELGPIGNILRVEVVLVTP